MWQMFMLMKKVNNLDWSVYILIGINILSVIIVIDYPVGCIVDHFVNKYK